MAGTVMTAATGIAVPPMSSGISPSPVEMTFLATERRTEMRNKITNVRRAARHDEPADDGTTASSTPPPDGQPRPAPRAHTLALQGVANRAVRSLLRTPLLCRVAGHWLMPIYLVGRTSGR